MVIFAGRGMLAYFWLFQRVDIWLVYYILCASVFINLLIAYISEITHEG